MKLKLTTDYLMIHIEMEWFIPLYFIGMFLLIYSLIKYRNSLKQNTL